MVKFPYSGHAFGKIRQKRPLLDDFFSFFFALVLRLTVGKIQSFNEGALGR